MERFLNKEPIFSITLEPVRSYYHAGDVINGYVKVKLRHEFSFTNIIIKCQGKDIVRTNSDKRTVNMLCHVHNALELEKVIRPNSGDKFTGEKKYPFEFSLPENLPSTWSSTDESGIMNIDYCVKAKLSGLITPLATQSCTFRVCTPFTIHEIPDYDLYKDEVTSMTLSTNSNFWLPKSVRKTISLKAIVLKPIITAGTDIEVEVEVRNDSKEEFFVLFGFSRCIKCRSNGSRYIGPLNLTRPKKECLYVKKKSSVETIFTIPTTHLANFVMQPSVCRSIQSSVKDHVFLAIGKAGGRKILKEIRLPVYIFSSGYDDDEQPSLPIELNIEPKKQFDHNETDGDISRKTEKANSDFIPAVECDDNQNTENREQNDENIYDNEDFYIENPTCTNITTTATTKRSATFLSSPVPRTELRNIEEECESYCSDVENNSNDNNINERRKNIITQYSIDIEDEDVGNTEAERKNFTRDSEKYILICTDTRMSEVDTKEEIIKTGTCTEDTKTSTSMRLIAAFAVATGAALLQQ